MLDAVALANHLACYCEGAAGVAKASPAHLRACLNVAFYRLASSHDFCHTILRSFLVPIPHLSLCDEAAVEMSLLFARARATRFRSCLPAVLPLPERASHERESVHLQLIGGLAHSCWRVYRQECAALEERASGVCRDGSTPLQSCSGAR